jgi:hypothetical protein
MTATTAQRVLVEQLLEIEAQAEARRAQVVLEIRRKTTLVRK